MVRAKGVYPAKGKDKGEVSKRKQYDEEYLKSRLLTGRFHLVNEIEKRAKEAAALSIDELGSLIKTTRETLESLKKEVDASSKPVQIYTYMKKPKGEEK